MGLPKILRILLLILNLGPFLLFAQEEKEPHKLVTFGIQFKPIIPNSFLDAGPVSTSNDVFTATFKPTLGYNFGMAVRKGFNKNFSLETGISFTRRNYDLIIQEETNDFEGTSDFTIVGYEVPVLGLIYVQLGERVFMNNAAGISFDMFPSDIRTSGRYYAHKSVRNEWIQMALLANVGFEYRTKNSGFLYFGGTYHRPITNIMVSAVSYEKGKVDAGQSLSLNGAYFTIDLRYFFSPDE